MSVGDEVVINIMDMIKQMQVNHGGWNDAMEECLVGPCKLIQHDGVDAVVQAPSGRMYRLNSTLLSNYNKDEESLTRYSVGDNVKVINDKNRVKVLQEGHGEWNELMTLILKKKGTVKLIHPNGDLQVEMKGTEIRLNPECVVKVKSDKGNSFLTEMMSLGLDDVTVSHSGDTPLHDAVRNKNYLLCCKLVEEGADVNALNEKKLTPMMLAAQIGCGNVLSLLVQRPDARLDIGDEDNDTALHLAVQNSNDDAVRILLEAGADVKATNNKQFTPFHLAAICGQEKILELCLDKYGGTLVDLQKDDKFAALHVAVINNHSDCLQVLIEHNADLNIRNNKMQTALHIAVSQKYMDCVKILVENEAQLDLQDKDGDTPLHEAINLHNINRSGMFGLGGMLTMMGGLLSGSDKPEDIAIYLVRHGASLDILNSAGKSPLTACRDRALREKLRKIQTELGQAAGSSGLETPSLVAETVSGNQEVEQMQQTIQNLQYEIMCVICRENRTNVVFNCGHRACNDCANNVDNCPMCRRSIETRIRIY